MGHYCRGDVVLAPVACEDRGGVKTRPAESLSSLLAMVPQPLMQKMEMPSGKKGPQSLR